MGESEMYEIVLRDEAPQEDELYHYGVKGMKWGVRKKAAAAAAGALAIGAAAYAVGKHRAKKQAERESAAQAEVKSLSDSELRERVNRLNLEQQYSRLISGGSDQVSSGQNYVSKLLKEPAINATKNVIQGLMTEAMNSAVNKARTAAGIPKSKK